MGVYIKGITIEMLRNASLEAVEDLLASGDMVEVEEPHGRLVDVNTAYQDTMIYEEKFRKSVLKIIDDLDTVIESEE